MSETHGLHFDVTDEDDLLEGEFAVPHVEHNLEEQADAERERYDEQILGALINP